MAVILSLREPIAFLDAAMLFVVQVLIARHPELMAPPETPGLRQPALLAAHEALECVFELQRSLKTYREILGSDDDGSTDDIQF